MKNIGSITLGKLPNHYHFLIRQDDEKPAYRIFNDVFSSYVKHYNFKYHRRGTLFSGALQHIHIKKENYLIALCQYIHYNPKKAKLVNNLLEWEFSNYPEWIGKRNGKLFNNELLNTYFGSSKDYKKQIEEYEKYVSDKEFVELLLDFNN